MFKSFTDIKHIIDLQSWKTREKNTDTIFELEILAQKMRAKICTKVQIFDKNAQKHNKIVQNCAKKIVKIKKI